MLWWQRKNNEKNWIKYPHFRALLIDYCFAPPSPISSCISSQSISCQGCSCPMENTSEQHCSSTYCMELQHTTQANWMYNGQNHVPHCFWLIIVDPSALLNECMKTQPPMKLTTSPGIDGSWIWWLIITSIKVLLSCLWECLTALLWDTVPQVNCHVCDCMGQHKVLPALKPMITVSLWAIIVFLMTPLLVMYWSSNCTDDVP